MAVQRGGDDVLTGYINGYDGEMLHIIVPFHNNAELLERQEITQCAVYLQDGRTLSPKQRNKIFALIADITAYTSGFDAKKAAFNETLRQMQLNYVLDLADSEEIRRALTYSYCDLQGIDLFSLSTRGADTIDMSTARDFIDWLVELCVANGIPCMDTLLNRCEDIQRYLYACVANRRCCICGQKADIHEVDKVGMGRNRRKIAHLGQRVQPLCRIHHNEVERIGQTAFDELHHLEHIRLDEHLCKKLGWRIASK
jgi:hypothetical protein